LRRIRACKQGADPLRGTSFVRNGETAIAQAMSGNTQMSLEGFEMWQYKMRPLLRGPLRPGPLSRRLPIFVAGLFQALLLLILPVDALATPDVAVGGATSDGVQSRIKIAGSSDTRIEQKTHWRDSTYPNIWDWQFPAVESGAPLELILLSNGDVLAFYTEPSGVTQNKRNKTPDSLDRRIDDLFTKATSPSDNSAVRVPSISARRLLFSSKTIASNESNTALIRVLREGRPIQLNDGSLVYGVTSLKDSVSLANGENISRIPNLANCSHGPIQSVYQVTDKQNLLVAKKVIFYLLKEPKTYRWKIPRSTPVHEVDQCDEEGPRYFRTRVANVVGDLLPLNDGTFLLVVSNGYVVRFDTSFLTDSRLLNHSVFVFDYKVDSELEGESSGYIETFRAKNYDIRAKGYQPLVDDIEKHLSKLRGDMQ
jgi:hypothetical protein